MTFTIRPVEWTEREDKAVCRAETAVGTYIVTAEGVALFPNVADPLFCETRETAQAACQADFERRIRAAIEEVPAEPDAALRAENEPDPDILREDRDERLRLEKEYPDDAW